MNASAKVLKPLGAETHGHRFFAYGEKGVQVVRQLIDRQEQAEKGSVAASLKSRNSCPGRRFVPFRILVRRAKAAAAAAETRQFVRERIAGSIEVHVTRVGLAATR